jgi:hypothetical protein
MSSPKVYRPSRGNFQLYRFTGNGNDGKGNKQDDVRQIVALTLEEAIEMWRYQMKGNSINKDAEPKNIQHLGAVTVVALVEEAVTKAA